MNRVVTPLTTSSGHSIQIASTSSSSPPDLIGLFSMIALAILCALLSSTPSVFLISLLSCSITLSLMSMECSCRLWPTPDMYVSYRAMISANASARDLLTSHCRLLPVGLLPSLARSKQ